MARCKTGYAISGEIHRMTYFIQVVTKIGSDIRVVFDNQNAHIQYPYLMDQKQKRPRQMILPPYLGPKRPINVFTAGVAALKYEQAFT